MLYPTITLPTLSDPGVNPSARVSPVPVRLIVFEELPGQLSFSVTVPFSVPATVGANDTVIVQFCPAVNVVGHVLLWRKSALLAIDVNFTEWLLTLVTVTVWEGLVSPTCSRPKFKAEAENVSVSGV